jgi:hypothetical protein
LHIQILVEMQSLLQMKFGSDCEIIGFQTIAKLDIDLENAAKPSKHTQNESKPIYFDGKETLG